MTDADPQTMKTAVPQVRDDVAQAVLTAVTAIELEPCNTCRQVELVMRDEALLGLDLPVPQGGSDALTTAILEGGRSQPAPIVLADAHPRVFAEQPPPHAEPYTPPPPTPP